MTIRNLDAVFNPTSVAIIGASEQQGSVGRVLTENLLEHFPGDIFLVNPKHRRMFDVKVFRDVERLPQVPDLAVIATPPKTVPGLIRALVDKGTRGACVITAGVDERSRGPGVSLRQEMLDAAKPGLLRIVGPNCLGIQVPGRGLDASFAHIFPKAGSIAFVAQSGAILTAVLDWAAPRDIGFSHIVSIGDMADVDFGDMLDYLANQPETNSILLYIEAISDTRKFMSAARAAARTKPVIVIKAGRHAEGARAASSHTGALAGHDGVYDAAFRRAGMLRVFTLEDLFDAVETLSTARPPTGSRLAILSNGGGVGVLATDALMAEGGELATLSKTSIDQLNTVLPPTWSHANPVDIIGDANGQRYADALKVLLDDRDCDGILILNCPTAVASSDEAATAVISTLPENLNKTVLTSWIGELSAKEPRRRFREQGIPTYHSPEDAVHAFSQMVNYQRNQALLMETPPSMPSLFESDIDGARRQIDLAVSENRQWLSEAESKFLLNAYGIPTVLTEVASSPAAVATVAKRFDGSVVIKILSPDITHKSDAGGVLLDVDPERAEEAAARMQERIKTARPDAALEGFTVQAMVRRPGARELIIGMVNDRQFGPVILFGQGGTAVEVLDDKALALPPLNLKLAHELVAHTNVYRLLQGYRDVPAANIGDIELALVRLSYLIADFPEIQELDINPLLADETGVLALDARVRVTKATSIGADRLAIRPYPKELEETIEVGNGRTLQLRPIVPEDGPALQSGFKKLSKDEIRNRFFAPLKLLSDLTAARFTQIDYDRQMALVLTERGIPGTTEIYGVVRLMEDPDRELAEFAIIVERSLTGHGLGAQLLRRVIEYARERGIGEIFGDVLHDNERMLKLCKKLGFSSSRKSGQANVVRVSLKLGERKQ
ncbi:MAG TPA: bifunctional acetate--CoA ligase family protein/GNAT family N-acetyltransferase [Woeseiaceae bacterium]|nr:bifunctional acetate--CoA ligase family protein/GNAT family N-acetyltransferase [Woeseiaceae bacterium]